MPTSMNICGIIEILVLDNLLFGGITSDGNRPYNVVVMPSTGRTTIAVKRPNGQPSN